MNIIKSKIMENYLQTLFFFIGKKNGATLEIKNILTELGVKFCDVSVNSHGLYCVDENEVIKIMSDGYMPYFVAIDNPSGVGVYAEHIPIYSFKNSVSSPLSAVALMLNIQLSDFQHLIVANDEDRYADFPYFCNAMKDLRRDGVSKDLIDKVRAFNRKGAGISEDEEREAEEALEKAEIHNGLIIIRDLPHTKFQAVLDRTFWLQEIQNIVIFCKNKEALYVGFSDLASGICQICGGSKTWNVCSFYCSDEQIQQTVCRKLLKESKRKKQDGIL